MTVNFSSPQTTFIDVGDKVVLNCSIERYQLEQEDVDIAAHIHLISPNRSILHSAESSPSLAHRYTTATIASFGRAHSGEYTCMAMYTSRNNPFLIDSDPKVDVIRITVGKSG